MTRVLIVAKTRLSGDARCIGAINAQGIGLRLSEVDGSSPLADTAYDIGDEWELDVVRKSRLYAPHVEDVVVRDAVYVGPRATTLFDAVFGLTVPWRCKLQKAFNGCLKTTPSGSAYVDATAIPAMSTGFWVSDCDLRSVSDGHGRVRYCGGGLSIKYVGDGEPVGTIAAGWLVRLSLARWWRETSAGPEADQRCYMQLSGWIAP